MSQIYVITHCYDWDDSQAIFETREEALTQIREDFQIDEYETEDHFTAPIVNDTEEFWKACDEAYENAPWKSYQFLVIDTETLTIADARRKRPS